MMSWLERLFNPLQADLRKNPQQADLQDVEKRVERVKEQNKQPLLQLTARQTQQLKLLKSTPKKSTLVTSQEQISLAAEAVTYTLVRKSRRNVSIRIDTDGLTVNAAMGTSMPVIEGFIRKHESWVLRKIEVWQARTVAPILWLPETELLLRGIAITLHWDQTRSSPVQVNLPSVKIGEPREERIAARVTQWLKREALVDFAERTIRLCRTHGIAPPRVMLSSAKHRWGSCNSKREVRLNWRLIQADPMLIDYVICHELAHLKHMNHSARFWAEVARMCPDYDRLRKQLQDLDHKLKRF
jgi:predicted metal-dependent hydrolase